MFQAMAIVRLKMGNLGLEVHSLKIRLTTLEGKKQGLIRQMQKEQEDHGGYKKRKGGRKKQKMEMEERMNAKILELNIENKELKRRLVVWTTLQKESQELRKKEEAWNKTKQQYQKQ